MSHSATQRQYPAQQVNRLRKSGDLEGAWNTGFLALQKTPADLYLRRELFWLCYSYLKGFQQNIIDRGQKTGNHQPNPHEYQQMDSLLNTMIGLNIPTGQFEYSRLLSLLRKNLDSFPVLVRFILANQNQLFTDEDRQPWVGDKGESPSLQLTCARKVAAAWLKNAAHWQLQLDDVLALLNLARQRCADTQHKLWLDYDQSRCLVQASRDKEARTFVVPVLKKKPTEAWAWGALAATYRHNAPDKAVTLFAKGVSCAHKSKFAVRLLVSIAQLLLQQQQKLEASLCIRQLLTIYQDEGWALKGSVLQLSQQTDYDSTVDMSGWHSLIDRLAARAMEYLHDRPARKCLGVVERCHRSGKGFDVYINKNDILGVRLGLHKTKSGKAKMPAPGDFVELTVVDAEGGAGLAGMAGMENIRSRGAEVLASRPCTDEKQKLPGVELFEGTFKLHPKGFGFIDDTFVPPHLVPEGFDGAAALALRVLQWDKKKGRSGWKAIRIEPTPVSPGSISDALDTHDAHSIEGQGARE